MKTINCGIAALLFVTSVHAQDTPRKAYELLVGCAVVYAKQHPSPRLTATELAEAAVASCDEYANKVRERAYLSTLADVKATLTPRQLELLGNEVEQSCRKNAEDIRSDAIAKARKEILQVLAEQ